MNQKSTPQSAKDAPAKKIPILIFTGFLGSGKTTLVNSLITNNPHLKIGVVVNEFGEVGFDSEIIQTEEEIKVEISNGCACCVVRDDLKSGVAALIKKMPDLDYVFIEASGLAEPEPIVQTFLHNLATDQDAYLDATICTIDTVNFVNNWDEFETLQRQIAHSDIVVLTKVEDPASRKDEVITVLHRAKPDIQIIEFLTSQPASVTILLDQHSFELNEFEGSHDHGDEKKHDHKHEDKHDHDHDNDHKHEHEDFDELVYITEAKLDPHALDKVFQDSSFHSIIRAKGFLNLDGQDQTMVFQLVGHGRQLSPYSKVLPTSKLVMIGKHLDQDKILADLQNCEV